LLQDVPTAIELAAGTAGEQMFRFIALKFKLARVFFSAPDVPAARIDVLRRAFDATMADRAYLDQARMLGLDANPIDGNGTAKLVREIQDTPADIVDTLRAVIERPAAR
jgi:hypothetical protein